MNLSVSHESGLQYAVSQVTYRGFSERGSEIKAVLDRDYTFGGLAQAVPTERRPAVPSARDEGWTIVDGVGHDERKWSGCVTKRTLTLRTRLSLTNATPGQNAYVSLASISRKKLAWRRFSY